MKLRYLPLFAGWVLTVIGVIGVIVAPKSYVSSMASGTAPDWRALAFVMGCSVCIWVAGHCLRRLGRAKAAPAAEPPL